MGKEKIEHKKWWGRIVQALTIYKEDIQTRLRNFKYD
jgi:hypothetical protein